jgi:hypothetical protein
MNSDQFCYWLQGYFELANRQGYDIDHRQAQIIRDHLVLVFDKKTPDRSGDVQIPPRGGVFDVTDFKKDLEIC